MDKKTYNIVAACVTGVIGIAAAVIAKINPPMEAAIQASLPVLEGAILTICGNFVVNAVIKANKKED
jgi:hypothetical protein